MHLHVDFEIHESQLGTVSNIMSLFEGSKWTPVNLLGNLLVDLFQNIADSAIILLKLVS